jgi:F-box interacting protein
MKFMFQYLSINHLSFSWRIRKPTKRKRKRKRIRRQRRRESTPPISQTTIMELPGHILIEILSKLPLDSILVSRCVCTTWCFFISDPLFSSLYLSKPQLFLRSNTLAHVTTTLHWVDTHSSILNTTSPSIHRRQINLNTKIHLPLPQTSTSCFMDQDFGIVNSCNGLLCLSKSITNNPHFICNPITGEFITVGHEEKEKSLWGSVFPGFGYCPKSKKYKVVRLVLRLESMFQRMAEVYTLGSTDSSWRSIGSAPFDLDLALFPTYLNGVIHWVKASDDEKKKGSVFIIGFDFEKEKFNEVSPPPHFGEKHKEKENLYNLNMGVLEGCLSLCDCTFVDHLDIWMMKEYGDPTSWTKEYVISTHFGGVYRPIKLLENGDLLIMYNKRELVAYDPIQGCFRFLRIQGVQSVFEAIIHVPSFIPLKDAVGEDHLNVQNVKARYKNFLLYSSCFNTIIYILFYWMVVYT